MSRLLESGKLLALAVTLALAGIVGYFAWSGFKAPPVAAASGIVTTPPGWVKLSGGSFTVFAPEGAQIRQAPGAGFVYGDIVGTALCVRYQAGVKANLMLTKKSHPDYTETAIVIDGHPAIVRKAYLAGHEQQYWFPACGAPAYAGLYIAHATADGGALSIEIAAANDEALEDAMTLFKSVRFAK